MISAYEHMRLRMWLCSILLFTIVESICSTDIKQAATMVKYEPDWRNQTKSTLKNAMDFHGLSHCPWE